MTTDRELDEILAELGREHRTIGAPDSLEPVLRAAADRGKNSVATPRLRWTWAAAAILLAGVAIAGLIWQTLRDQKSQTQQVLSVSAPQVKPEPTPTSPRVKVRQNVPPKPASLRKGGTERASLRGGSAPQQATWNSLDEFVPLPVSEGLPHAAELSVVRIKLKGSDLQQYGLVAPPDAIAKTMLAEFVVGEDGLPRAIRIVR